jgi:hypothetical protein
MGPSLEVGRLFLFFPSKILMHTLIAVPEEGHFKYKEPALAAVAAKKEKRKPIFDLQNAYLDCSA